MSNPRCVMRRCNVVMRRCNVITRNPGPRTRILYLPRYVRLETRPHCASLPGLHGQCPRGAPGTKRTNSCAIQRTTIQHFSTLYFLQPPYEVLILSLVSHPSYSFIFSTIFTTPLRRFFQQNCSKRGGNKKEEMEKN